MSEVRIQTGEKVQTGQAPENLSRMVVDAEIPRNQPDLKFVDADFTERTPATNTGIDPRLGRFERTSSSHSTKYGIETSVLPQTAEIPPASAFTGNKDQQKLEPDEVSMASQISAEAARLSSPPKRDSVVRKILHRITKR